MFEHHLVIILRVLLVRRVVNYTGDDFIHGVKLGLLLTGLFAGLCRRCVFILRASIGPCIGPDQQLSQG